MRSERDGELSVNESDTDAPLPKRRKPALSEEHSPRRKPWVCSADRNQPRMAARRVSGKPTARRQSAKHGESQSAAEGRVAVASGGIKQRRLCRGVANANPLQKAQRMHHPADANLSSTTLTRPHKAQADSLDPSGDLGVTSIRTHR
jgi:hypothetical protein